MKRRYAHILFALVSAVIFFSENAFAQETNVSAAPSGSFGKAISGVFGKYMDFLATATGNIFGALQGSFMPFAVSVVTLYILVVGYKLLRGDLGAATKEFATSCFLIVFLASLVFSPGVYQEYIFSPFIGTVSDLSSFFVSKGAGVPINSQADILNYMGTTLESIWTINTKMDEAVGFLDKLSAFSFKVLFAELMLAGAYIACIAAYIYMILQAWFAIFMYMIIGGICVFFSAFKATRFLTVAWFRSLSHEGLTIIFSSLIMGISGNIIQSLITILKDVDVGANGIFTPQYFAVLLASILAFLMLLKAPQLAGSLSGGSAGSTSGVAAAVGTLAGGSYAALKTSALWAGGKAARGLGNIGSSAAANLSSGRGGGGGGSHTPFSDAKGTSPTGN